MTHIRLIYLFSQKQNKTKGNTKKKPKNKQTNKQKQKNKKTPINNKTHKTESKMAEVQLKAKCLRVQKNK